MQLGEAIFLNPVLYANANFGIFDAATDSPVFYGIRLPIYQSLTFYRNIIYITHAFEFV